MLEDSPHTASEGFLLVVSDDLHWQSRVTLKFLKFLRPDVQIRRAPRDFFGGLEDCAVAAGRTKTVFDLYESVRLIFSPDADQIETVGRNG